MKMTAGGVPKTPAFFWLLLFNGLFIKELSGAALDPRDDPEETLKTSENSKRSAKYEFGYAVRDGIGGQQGHLESREGEYGLGLYYVNLPNSETSVQYFTDGLGYHPLVQYSSQGPPGASTKTQFALGKEAVLALKNTAQKLSSGIEVKSGRTLAAAAAAAVAAAATTSEQTEKIPETSIKPSTLDTIISLDEAASVNNLATNDNVELKAAPSTQKIKYGVKLKSVIIRDNENNREKVQIRSTTPGYTSLKPIVVADIESSQTTTANLKPIIETITNIPEEIETSTTKSVEISSSYSAPASPSDHIISPPPPAPPTEATILITPRPNQPILTPSVVQAQAALALVPPTQQPEKTKKISKYNTIVEVHKSIPIELDNFHLTIEQDPSNNKAEDGLNGIPVEYIQQLVDEGEKLIQEQLEKNNLENKPIFSPQAVSNNNDNNNLDESNLQKVPSELSQAVPVEYSPSAGDYVPVNTIKQIENSYQTKVKQHLSEPIEIISPVRIEQIETQSQKEEKLLKQEEENIQDVQKVEEESQHIEVIHKETPKPEQTNEKITGNINSQQNYVVQPLAPQAQVQILVPHSQYNYNFPDNNGPIALPLISPPRQFTQQQDTSQNLQIIEETPKDTNQFVNTKSTNSYNGHSRPVVIVEGQPLHQAYTNTFNNYGNHQPIYEDKTYTQEKYAQDVAEEEKLAQTAFQQQQLIAQDIEKQIQQQQQQFEEQQNQIQGLLDVQQQSQQVNYENLQSNGEIIQNNIQILKQNTQIPSQNQASPTQFQTQQQQQQDQQEQQNDPRKIISNQTLKAAREGYRKNPDDQTKQLENQYNVQLIEEFKQDQANFARLLAVADWQIQKNEGENSQYPIQEIREQLAQDQLKPTLIHNNLIPQEQIHIIQDNIQIQPIEGNINQQLIKVPLGSQTPRLQVSDQAVVSESHQPPQIYIAPTDSETKTFEHNNQNSYEQNEHNSHVLLPQPQLTKIIEKPVPVEVTKVIEVPKEVKVPHPIPVQVTKLIPVDRPVPYPEPYPHPIPVPVAVPHPVEVPVPHYVPYPQLVAVPYKEIHPVYIQNKVPSQLQEPPPRKIQFSQNHGHSLVKPWYHEGARYAEPSSYFQPPPITSSHPFHQGAHLLPRLKGAATINSGVALRPPRHHKPKALCIEYGFKPPLRPSTQIHDESLMIQDKSDTE